MLQRSRIGGMKCKFQNMFSPLAKNFENVCGFINGLADAKVLSETFQPSLPV